MLLSNRYPRSAITINIQEMESSGEEVNFSNPPNLT